MKNEKISSTQENKILWHPIKNYHAKKNMNHIKEKTQSIETSPVYSDVRITGQEHKTVILLQLYSTCSIRRK